MPIYEYECQACQHSFEEYQSIHADALVKCPQCKKKKLMRVIGVPLLAKVSTPRTLGALAEQNSRHMSAEEKSRISEQQKTKRDEVLYDQLPAGMERVEKPKKVEEPWYKKNQTVSDAKLAKLSKKQKHRYVMTGKCDS